MISYQTDGVKMPDIKKKETTEWIKEVAACYGKRVGEIAYIFCSIYSSVWILSAPMRNSLSNPTTASFTG